MKRLLIVSYLLSMPLFAMQQDQNVVDISNLDKKAILLALFKVARPQGWGFLHYHPDDTLSDQEVDFYLSQDYIDYLKGRLIKISLMEGTILDVRLFNKYNGPSAAQCAIAQLRDGKSSR